MSSNHAQVSGQGTTRFQQLGLALLGASLAGLGIWMLSGFADALTWSAIFAIATRPLYVRVRRRWPPGGHNVLLPTLFTLVVALVFLAPLVVIGINLGKEASSVIKLGLDYQRTGIPVPAFVSELPFGHMAVVNWWQANLSDPGSLSEMIGRINRDKLAAFTATFGTKLLHHVVSWVFTMLTLFFLFRDGDTIARQMHCAATRAFGYRAEEVGTQLIASVHGTVNGLVLVGIGEGVLIGISYWIAGVPQATLLGTGTAVAAMVPFGAPIVFGFSALILVVNSKLVAAAVVLAFGFLVTLLADHFVRPALIGGATRLPFLWVLLGILGGVETFGLIGLFIGPAVMSALIFLWREWVAGYGSAQTTGMAGRPDATTQR
jgi:predicted PurR-regulated permease PerM